MSLSESYLNGLINKIHKIISEKDKNPLEAYYKIKEIFELYNVYPYNIDYIIECADNEVCADKENLFKEDTVLVKNEKETFIGEVKSVSGNEIKLKDVFKLTGYRSKTLELDKFDEVRCLSGVELKKGVEENDV